MRKTILAVIMLLCTAKYGNAQITESRIKVDSMERQALYIETDMPEDDVKDALKDYFDSLHVSPEKGTGFIIKKQLPFLEFKRAVTDSMHGQALDYYFEIDTRKQKGADATTIYIVASRGYNNFISPQTDAAVWSAFRNFTEYMRSNYFEQYRIKKNMTSLTRDLNKDKSKLKDVAEEKIKLEKSIEDKNAQLATMQTQLDKLKNKQP